MADPKKARKASRPSTNVLSEEETTPIAHELKAARTARHRLNEATFPRPSKTRVLTIANQKGGVGKTTSTVNVAAALAKHGLRVLVIDCDPQGNASTAFGVDHSPENDSIYDVLLDDLTLGDVVRPSNKFDNLLVAPATIDLSGAEIELVSETERETRLKKALGTYLNQNCTNDATRVDYVFIDCPPSLGLLTLNAMVAADEIFIPIQCEYYALEGLSQLLKNINLVSGALNPDLEVSTILLTMYDKRTNLSTEVAQDVRAHFPDQTLNTKIPRSVRISEAPSYEETVITYDPNSTGAIAYEQAALEIAQRGVKN